ncbi:hypothetical protein [Roseimicrobium sp. ORNL1]|uniref:hypothetical protein n=1 Tax=Roseimicrobium sp. ORNL1 TaxID=2711231 RepID=UPI0013E0F64D|nr:hypothetical protein [Roseimicrobium sp. ORNL1]QIF01976.1 hypothetical protein G5S37_10685 [Roseimicrobium sp. ORNL1]
MSRRSAIWIMVLFLGLTGIPMVYCILTWSPAEPLRFRITRDLGTGTSSTSQLAAFARPLRELEVEVENTRGVTIQFHGATVWVPDSSGSEAPFFGQLDLSSEIPRVSARVSTGTGTGSGSGGTTAASRIMSGARSSGSSIVRTPLTVSIPSHRTRSFRIHVLEGSGPSSHAGELRVQYLWTSQPRHLTGRSLTWLRLHLPAIFRSHVPRIIPDESTTTIQLTSGPGTSG